MLVLSRRPGETLFFPGLRVAVQVLAARPGAVRLGIDAPPEVCVMRGEVVGPKPTTLRPGRPGRHRLTRELRRASLGVGLARLQLQAGRVDDAQGTLARLHEEIQQLRRLLEGEGEKTAPRPRAECAADSPGDDEAARERFLACLA
jgi:carbon storage regulator CsrA